MKLNVPLFPEAASSIASSIDQIYLGLIGITGIVTIGIFVAIIYFIVKYREGSKANRTPSKIAKWKLETTWIAFPFILFLAIFVWSSQAYYKLYRIPQEGMEIYVVARQWMWKFEHLSGYREINNLHVPLGTKIKLLMTSQDVIHSFFVPAFRIKKDVLPGRYTHVWFEATKTGQFHLFCAEYCGTNHSRMIGTIHVLHPADYSKWQDKIHTEDISLPSLSSRGREVFHRLDCTTCHRDQDYSEAPLLKGLFGRQVQLSRGATVTADENYIRNSILYPKTQIVQGYPSSMPSYLNKISEQELIELVAYIKSLALAQSETTEKSTELKRGIN